MTEKVYQPKFRWTDEEDNILREHYGKGRLINYELLQEELDRTYGAICNRAQILGLSSKEKCKERIRIRDWDVKFEKFMKIYNDTGSISDACESVNIKRIKLEKALEKDTEKAEKYKELKDRLKEMFICRGCNKELPNCENYIDLTKNPGAKKLCQKCQTEKRLNYNTSFDGKIVTLLKNARNRGKEYNLSLEYMKNIYNEQKGLCYYTGKEMTFPLSGTGKVIFTSMSIDRKDSKIGYIKGNVVLCCWLVNRMKNDCSDIEFIELAHLIADKFPKIKQDTLIQEDMS